MPRLDLKIERAGRSPKRTRSGIRNHRKTRKVHQKTQSVHQKAHKVHPKRVRGIVPSLVKLGIMKPYYSLHFMHVSTSRKSPQKCPRGTQKATQTEKNMQSTKKQCVTLNRTDNYLFILEEPQGKTENKQLNRGTPLDLSYAK